MHLAIIMDGNRRWARQRGLIDIEGHRAGAERIKPLVEHAAGKGVEYLTFWAFSTENWKRKDWVADIFRLFREYLVRRDLFEELIERGGKINVLGDLSRFPEDIQEGLRRYRDRVPEKVKIEINFCLNYGGRAEILRAAKKIVGDGIEPSKIDEALFERYLYSAGQPNPDFVVRTGGEERLSGFMPWQLEYAELYFTDVLWPDFTPVELDKALVNFSKRERRFGQ